MDELIALLFLIIIPIILIPVIVLVKISSIQKGIKESDRHIKDLGAKLDKITGLLAAGNVQDMLERPVAEQAVEIATQPFMIDKEPIGKLEPPPVPAQALHAETATSTVQSHYAALEANQPDVIYDAPQTEIADIPITTANKPEAVREKNALEKFLTENVLSKIGIVTLVLGIGFFVKYAIDQEWINEVGRVGIGIFTGGLIIGVAHKLRQKYDIFSSILVGGGIAVFYITVTLAFREYNLFTQPVAFTFLIAITVFSVILTLLYNRVELAVFSLLGGFAAPLMVSSGEGNYIVLFSYLFILNTGMLVLSFWKNWRILGIISYTLTLFFLGTWLSNSFDNEFAGATVFVALFFVQFYLLALFDHHKTNNKITSYQVILILTLNLFAFLACLYIFDGYAYDLRGIVTITPAVANAIVLTWLFRKSAIDRNLLYLIIAIVLTFVSLAIPMQLNGHVITMFWAAEMCILLFLWQKSRIPIIGNAFLIIGLLILISYMLDVAKNYFLAESGYLQIVTNRMFITGLVMIAGYCFCLWRLKKENAESAIEFKNAGISVKTRFIRKTGKLVIIFTSYIVPLLELNYQVKTLLEQQHHTSFRFFLLATFTFAYIAALCLIYYRKTDYLSLRYGLLSVALAAYATLYAYIACHFRYDVFENGYYPANYFLYRFIALSAICFITFYLVRKIKEQRICSYKEAGWILFFICVAILSIELDHIAIMLPANNKSYSSILFDTHTFGYPILWGCIAFVLMIWGLKAKEVVLRKISLFFFGAIIIKFYAYDVWNMSQAGRIISFVVLGILLLTVSFLQQRIKVLVKDENQIKNENDE